MSPSKGLDDDGTCGMMIQSLERPDTMPELAHWLERQLVGDDLGTLIAELRSVSPSNGSDAPSLNELLGSNFTEVLHAGLGALSEDQLRTLFRYPDRLLELQELVLIEGGNYWDDVPRTKTLVADSERNWETLQNSLASPVPKKLVLTSNNLANAEAVETSSSQQGNGKAARQRGNDKPILNPSSDAREPAVPGPGWLRLVAATFLVGLGIGWLMSPGETKGMAWTRPGVFRQTNDRKEFLTRLATLAHEWFDKRPTTAAEMAERLVEFRHGCALLQLNQAAIPAADHDWLLGDCRKWSDELDRQLIALEQGASLNMVKASVDATIQKLIDKLRDKASKIV